MKKNDLHYTLLLLIPSDSVTCAKVRIKFTLHFATINTSSSSSKPNFSLSFTLHFATINTIDLNYEEYVDFYIYITLCYY